MQQTKFYHRHFENISIQPTEKRIFLAVRLDDETFASIHAFCRQKNITLSDEVRECLYLRHNLKMAGQNGK